MWFAILRDTAAGENSKVYISNPQYYTQIATIDIQADEDVWQHTALTRADDGKIRLFINGVLKGTLSNDFSAGAFGGKTRGYIALENATFQLKIYYPNYTYKTLEHTKGLRNILLTSLHHQHQFLEHQETSLHSIQTSQHH